jgi:DNA repair protein RadD
MTVTMSADERYTTRDAREYSKDLLEKMGQNVERNRAIVRRLSELPNEFPTLCFASSVSSARVLAAAMVTLGRSAAVIDAETGQASRRDTLSAFQAGAIQFLFNFGVLATGFDAPSVRCLVIARPTRSAVLLEQMIGRGLRGPLNGGTDECLLLWIEDDFASAEELKPLSYQRFATLWSA